MTAARPEDVLELAREIGLLDDHLPAGAPAEVLAALLRERRLSPSTVRELELELEVGNRALRSPEAPPAAGAVRPPLARYHVGALLGEGGVGQVWRAFDPRLERFVALKVLRDRDAVTIAALVREAQAQARLEHPNVCRVYEVGDEGGCPYIAMQLVNGPTLARVEARLSLADKVRVVRQVASGVHAAHLAGLVHRDLKPGNILVERLDDGGWVPYVTDFGLAQDRHRAAGGEVAGTAPFMAPEQARGRDLDARADVYGLGATLYALVAGRPPFVGSREEVLRDVLARDPPRPRLLAPSLPRDVEAIIRRCLEKRPADRYATARELGDDLGRWLDGVPARARRRPWLAGAAALGLVAALALGAMWMAERRAAGRRAQLGQRLGERVERMVGIMRTGLTLPLHDVRPEKERVRRELDQIGRDMAEQGPVAEGIGRYALGRGRLALGELDEARAELERAWAAGQRTPETARALGLALSALYQRGLVEADRLDATSRALRQRNLAAAYREPALRYLREAGGGPDLHVEALLAFHDGRLDEARALAARAADAAPALYEARQLEGEAWTALARAEPPDDRRLAKLALAGGSFARALDVGRSDPALWRRECDRLERASAALLGLGRPSDEERARALAACDRAVAADPDDAGGYTSRATVGSARARRAFDTGGDLRAATAPAIADAETATRLAPRAAVGWIALGQVVWLRGLWERDRGGDSVLWEARAVGALERAEALAPANRTASLILGRALAELAYALEARGVAGTALRERAVAAYERSLAREADPLTMGELARVLTHLGQDLGRAGRPWRSYYGRALSVAGRARARWPDSAEVLGYVSETYTNWAYRELEDGGDPRPQVALAIAVDERAAALNPASWRPLADQAFAYEVLVEHGGAVGADVEEAAARAVELYRRVLAVKPDAWTYVTMEARVHLMVAGIELDRHAPVERVRAVVARGRERAVLAARGNPDSDRPLAILANLCGVEVELAARSHGDVRAAFATAVAAYDRALAANAASAYSRNDRADVHIKMGDWLLDGAHDPAGARAQAAEGLKWIGRALDKAPGVSGFLVTRGRLLQLAARAGDRGAARAARDLFADVLAAHPSLRRELAPRIAALDALLQGEASSSSRLPQGSDAK